MKRLLVWLNRLPCRCVKANGGVVRHCWRHAFLDWLSRCGILCVEKAGYYYHDGRIEWCPWYWGAAGYVRAYRKRFVFSPRRLVHL